MNLTSKQRAYLGSEASTMNAIFQIGKASLTPELINGLDEALEKLLQMVRDLGQERTFAYMKFLLGCEKDY